MSGYLGAVFDVDGVLVDSPHEQAWRESLRELMAGPWADIVAETTYSPEAFTPALYHDRMSGKPRLAGARAALEYFGVPDLERRTEEYGAHKQEMITRLISDGSFSAYDDALRFVLAVADAGIPVASASSSKNAGLFLSRVRLDTFAAEHGLPYGWVTAGLTLRGLFDVDVSGRDFAHGKPDPEIFSTAAAELGIAPEECFVVEDAVNGVQAATAGGFGALGVARANDTDRLAAAGADVVVTSLDDVDLGGLSAHELREHAPGAS